MRFSLLLTSGLAILFLSGCLVGEKGSGTAVTETREVDEFDSVALSGSGDVHLVVGESRSVIVTFDDNLIEMVRTEVKNGELRIYTKGSWSSRLGLNVEVQVPALSSVSVSGAGDINLEGMTGKSLKVDISGTGDITAEGSVDNLTVEVSGVGEADLEHLKSKTVDVSVSGTGNATVFASESVDASVSGVGDVEVYGNPADVEQSTSGLGDVTIKK